ncbi:unnamed protein product [Macrosiphum euphorbiae]|uniref:Uncharacterized protein n=1 Tax=Macrosiphum euphorbiae TaxID=13131 RepID=A0AAV0W1J7_9HEMI|nr:unnamed protein product [Macrosiphum euphorbiae]
MTFYRSKSMMSFDYRLGGISIQRASQVHDLGILFVPSLNFRPHIGYMTTKAFRVLGFIRRHSFNFSSTNCILALYYALVRSIIEYGSVVWSPYIAIDICRTVSVQNSCMRFAGHCLNIPHLPHDYGPIFQALGLDSLSVELMQGRVDATRLLGELSFHIPSNTRLQFNLYIPTNKSNFSRNASLLRMIHNANNKIDY